MSRLTLGVAVLMFCAGPAVAANMLGEGDFETVDNFDPGNPIVGTNPDSLWYSSPWTLATGDSGPSAAGDQWASPPCDECGDLKIGQWIPAPAVGTDLALTLDWKQEQGPAHEVCIYGVSVGDSMAYWAGGTNPGTLYDTLELGLSADWTTVTVNFTWNGAEDYMHVMFRSSGEWASGQGDTGLDNVLLEESGTGVPGDTDGDGDVDLDDLFAVRNNFGTTTGGTLAGGDTDGDGDVDLDDLFTVRNNFGTGLIVPEPMTLSLLGLGAAAFIRRRR